MRYIKEYKSQKENTVNIILYSVILGVAINVISDALDMIFDVKPWISLVVSVVITGALVLVTLIYNIKKLGGTVKYGGALMVNRSKNNKIVAVPSYGISEDMENYIEAASAEDKELAAKWNNAELNSCKVLDVDDDEKLLTAVDDGCGLVTELIEYCLLENLSMFIADYFNMESLYENLVKFDRADIPDILISNRFLNLFSESPSNRSSFVNDRQFVEDERERIISGYSKSGALFRRLYLSLPKGTVLKREKKNTVTIDTKLFVMRIKVLYGGFNAFIENEFIDYYVKNPDAKCSSHYEFNIEVDIDYKLSSIFKIADWRYYNWLDIYLEQLRKYCDIQALYEQIRWQECKAIIRAVKDENLTE